MREVCLHQVFTKLSHYSNGTLIFFIGKMVSNQIGAREIHELAKNGSNLVQDGGNN